MAKKEAEERVWQVWQRKMTEPEDISDSEMVAVATHPNVDILKFLTKSDFDGSNTTNRILDVLKEQRNGNSCS